METSKTFFEVVLFAVAVTVFSALVWISVVWLVGKLSGWGTVARACPGRTQPTADRYLCRVAAVGKLSSYKNCIFVWFHRDGVYFRPHYAFRWNHPAIDLPWEIFSEARPYGLFKKRSLRLEVDPEIHTVRFILPAKAVDDPSFPPRLREAFKAETEGR